MCVPDMGANVDLVELRFFCAHREPADDQRHEQHHQHDGVEFKEEISFEASRPFSGSFLLIDGGRHSVFGSSATEVVEVTHWDVKATMHRRLSQGIFSLVQIGDVG